MRVRGISSMRTRCPDASLHFHELQSIHARQLCKRSPVLANQGNDRFRSVSDPHQEVPVHFVGSIAFYLKDELEVTFDKYQIKLGNVLRRPIDGLIAYHVANK